MNFDEWYERRGFDATPGEKELMEIAFTSGVASNRELSEIASTLHYPECWDTAAYPTLLNVVEEIFVCSNCSRRSK